MHDPLSNNREPVTTIEDLRTLDHVELGEGYLDGLKNEPCGDNRSRSYWHGWKNGMVDAGHAQCDVHQATLARAFVADGRLH